MARNQGELLQEFNTALIQKIQQKYPVANNNFQLGDPGALAIFKSTMDVTGIDGQQHQLLIDYMRGLGQDSFRIVIDGTFKKGASVTFLPWSPRRFTDSVGLREKAALRIFEALDSSMPAPKAAA